MLKTEKQVTNEKRLNAYLELESDWDGYGAESFEKELIDFAKELLCNIYKQPKVFPTGRGSVQFEYENKYGRYLEFEIFSYDNIQLFFVDEHGEKIEKQINKTEINDWIKHFYEEN